LYTCKKYPGEIYQNVQNRKKLNFIHWKQIFSCPVYAIIC
jgi:hypothetical protein